MSFAPTDLERAFELARTGLYKGAAAIREQLRAEGFDWEQVFGPTLKRQLLQECQRARQRLNNADGGRAGDRGDERMSPRA